jgi:hypothetical protein
MAMKHGLRQQEIIFEVLHHHILFSSSAIISFPIIFDSPSSSPPLGKHLSHLGLREKSTAWLLASKLANGSKGNLEVILSLRRSPKTFGRACFANLIILRKIGGTQSGHVVIKTAPKERFKNEWDVLKHFRNCLHIRQLLDETKDPPSVVL